jgi:protein-S-isoprenylcysteine O-methyltransferase Ste14
MVKLPPPLWGLIFLAIMGAASALYDWKAIVDLTIVPLGIVLIVAGVALPFWAVRVFTGEGTELNPTSATNKTLVISGPYRFTRNPMYLGLCLLTLGIAFAVGSLPMFAVPILIFATANWVHIPFEEAKMSRQFAEQFADYCNRVRRWI